MFEVKWKIKTKNTKIVDTAVDKKMKRMLLKSKIHESLIRNYIYMVKISINSASKKKNFIIRPINIIILFIFIVSIIVSKSSTLPMFSSFHLNRLVMSAVCCKRDCWYSCFPHYYYWFLNSYLRDEMIFTANDS